MIKSHNVELRVIKARMEQNGFQENMHYTDLNSGVTNGIAFVTPVNEDDTRNQDLHCMVFDLGDGVAGMPIDDVYKFLMRNFVNSGFLVEYFKSK